MFRLLKYNKKNFTNYLSLSSFQIANYIVPFITIPYVVRIIGVDNYGLVSFAQAFVQYFVLIINYGFNLTATRNVASNRNNKNKIETTIVAVTSAKILLFFFSFLLFVLSAFLIPQINQNLLLFSVTFLITIGIIFDPIWLFQGFEDLRFVAVMNFVIKLLFALSIFIFLREKSEYVIIPLSLSLAQIFVGMSSYIYGLFKFKININLHFVRGIIILNELREGFAVFVSTIVINLYTISNIVILGFLSTNKEVGYFTGASKIVGAMQAVLLMPITQILYPKIAYDFKISYDKGIILLKKSFYLICLFGILGFIILIIFSSLMVNLVLGKSFDPSIRLLMILSSVPLIIGLSNLFGIQCLLNLKKDRIFLKITSLGSLFSIFLSLILVPFYGSLGSSITWLLTEFIITSLFYFALKKENINIIDKEYFLKLFKV